MHKGRTAALIFASAGGTEIFRSHRLSGKSLPIVAARDAVVTPTLNFNSWLPRHGGGCYGKSDECVDSDASSVCRQRL
jgi:hypothetical protein